jgi:histidinol-phosphatase (PHP family)
MRMFPQNPAGCRGTTQQKKGAVMKLSCLHTHTTFCDGKNDVEAMCRAAAEKGLVSIGFSSHAPIARKTGIKTDWHMPDERLDEYIEAVRGAQRRWQGRLDVYLGLEVDFIEGLCGPAGADFQKLPLDYIIGSVHYVTSPKNGERFTVDCPGEEFRAGFRNLFDNDGTALYNAYFDAYCAMIRAGGFDIAGHFDLVKKNNGVFRFFSAEDPAYEKRLMQTAECIAAFNARQKPYGTQTVVEVNTGGMNRGCTADPYPSVTAMKLLGARNVPLVITADAHSTEHVGGHYAGAARAMLDAGYAHSMLFAGKQNGKARWTMEELE